LTAIEIRSSRPANDRRTQRTRAALLDAFRVIMLEDGFDACTPTRLAAAANVGRSTFYEHFASVEELLGVSIGRLLGPLAASTLAPRMDPAAIDILQHFWENRRIGKAMLTGGARPVVVAVLAERFEAGLTAQRTTRSPRLAATFLTAGMIAVLEAWLSGRVQGAPAEIAEALHAAGSATARAMGGPPSPST
jgi:AcrR family transcriptional regulator